MDRTAEYKAAVSSLLNRGTPSRQHHSNAYSNHPARKGKEAAAYAEFSKLASSIGHDIKETSEKLEKLKKLVKRKALFDDRPVEISELTYVIKQDLSRLNAQTMALQKHVRATAAKANRSTRQMDEHSTNLVIILQSRLANTSMGFKEALEIRSESMQASKKRQDQLLQSGQPHPGQSPPQGFAGQQQNGHQQSLQLPQTGILSSLRNTTKSPIGLVPTSASPPQAFSSYTNDHSNNIPQSGRTSPFMQPLPSNPNQLPLSSVSSQSSPYQQYQISGSSDIDPYSGSSMHRRKGRTDDYHGQSQHYYEDDSESAGPASMLFQQQQHAPHVEQYVQNRSTAIEAVESTLQELGGIFQQLAQMVAEQRDTIQRIEANTDDIELNINEAQNQLLRYYRNISSDRWLMIKLFLTIIFVFLVMSLLS
ncbi:cis-Golgi t-SNARE syntaxin [Lobosporangium transversale]|uniref:t-SNARE n=1 Tax=Lobosporangium transversale TaxID=64571 RepID=A0A1Y2GAK9_9FUNG|nr:t-SNARE [Lobosporangium transversale]KAF9907342.1 cis-Golgi t-SNARE syntaxin [Lobosporangium transversale]ORZ05501.1 t-SNARE [Lobosporangium transversale]|eukprot:XP_021877075.1 t-SNARE [Lobosporangium transversale]